MDQAKISDVGFIGLLEKHSLYLHLLVAQMLHLR